MDIVWTERLSVGNAIIDSDHKGLIAMVNCAMYAIRNGDKFMLTETLEQIEQPMHAYFANKIKIAHAIQFPFHQNNLEHEFILLTLHHLSDLLLGRKGAFEEGAADHFCELLGDWLINHIINEDMRMKPILQTFAYDFEPAGFYPVLVKTEACLRI